MIKKERFKLFDLSTLDGGSGYDHLNKSLKEFFSEHFESGKDNKESYYKFPIKRNIPNSPKKRQKNLNFGSNKEISEEIKNQKYNLNRYKNKFQLEMLNLSNESNKLSTKKFHIFNKSKRKNVINLIKKSKNNNLELSSDSLHELNIRTPKNRTYNKFKFIGQKNIDNKYRINSSRTLRHKISNINNNNLKNFSFTNFIKAKFRNKDKKISELQSQSSTQIKTFLRNVSYKSDNDNNAYSSKIKSPNKNKKVKPTFYLRLNEDNKADKENLLISDDDSILSSPNNYGNNGLKTTRQNIKLKDLLFQVQEGKKNHIFKPNEYDIKSRVNLLTKFNRDLFLKTMKSASRNNNFFFNFPFRRNKFGKNNKKSVVPHQGICNNRSIKLLKHLQKLQANAKNKNREIKLNRKHNFDFEKLKNVLNKTRIENNFDIKVDEKFKNDAVKYQEKIGKFFIFQGNGIYSEHLNILLKGDKISHSIVKLDNL